jgi:hypothetical protein
MATTFNLELRLQSQTSTSVVLTWSPVEDCRLYELEYRIDGSDGSWTCSRVENGDTTTSLHNLTPNTSYRVRIRATLPSGFSGDFTRPIKVHVRLVGHTHALGEDRMFGPRATPGLLCRAAHHR